MRMIAAIGVGVNRKCIRWDDTGFPEGCAFQPALFSSSTNGTGISASTPTRIHCETDRDVVWKIICSVGTDMAAHCRAMQKITLNRSFLLVKNPILKMEWVLLLMFRE